MILFTGSRPWTPDEHLEGMPKSAANPAHSCDDWAESADISSAWWKALPCLKFPTSIWLRLANENDMTKVAEMTGVEYLELVEMYLDDIDILHKVINGGDPNE